MGLQRFDIYFDNAEATYYGGQTVSGRLFLHLDASKRIRGIQIQVRGEAEVRWTETRHSRDGEGKVRPTHEYFRGHELYFENKYFVLGGTGSEIMLQAGDHCYPFSTVLPETLPCSFEGRYGHIRYTVRAILHRPWKHDHISKAAFSVIKIFDLNTETKLNDPIVLSKEKWLGCWCLRSGPIGLSMRAPASGVVPGQKLALTIEMENSTREIVNRVCIELAQVVTFHAAQGTNIKSRTDKLLVASEELGGLEARAHRIWDRKLHIPTLPPSQLNDCKVIDLEYILIVKAEMYGAVKEVALNADLILGTVPLKKFWPTLTPIPLTPLPLKIEDGLDVRSVSSEIPSPYPELPPPLHEECSQGPHTIREPGETEYVHGCLDFAPCYPTFNFDQ